MLKGYIEKIIKTHASILAGVMLVLLGPSCYKVDSATTIGVGDGGSSGDEAVPVSDDAEEDDAAAEEDDGDDTEVVQTVTVEANTAPTITTVESLSMAMGGGSATVSFTVGDSETPPSELSVRAASGNITLIPDAALVLQRDDGNFFTLSITPAAGRNGFAPITLVVSDGSLLAATSFIVNVTNTAPTISIIPDQAISLNAATSAISFTVADAEASAANLTVAATSTNTNLLPANGIVLSGLDGTRTITLTPATGMTGVATVTVSVSDGQMNGSQSFVLSVGNSGPSISTITNQTIPVNGVTEALTFTISDAQMAAADLTLAGSSTNTGLVPNNGIVFGGSGANRTVTVTPNADASGNSTISILVSDGMATSAASFVLAVTNSAPTITGIATQNIGLNTSTGSLGFTIADAETAAASLTLTKASSNTTLVPNSGIAFGGSGANRTVTVTPATGQVGTATITMTVADGEQVAATSFAVTVSNSAPTISAIADQTIPASSATSALAFTIGDTETAAASLTLTKASSNTTLVPLAGIVFGGAGENRTVTVTPAAGTSGISTVTIFVSDGLVTSAKSFVVVVTNSAPSVTSIADQSIAMDNPTAALAFTIADSETAAANLTLNKASSNTTLIPLSGITFGGAGANRTVTVTPATGQAGTASVTVAVSDGELTTATAFSITVSNTTPTISAIGNQSVTTGNSTGAIAFTITDAETAEDSLTVTRASSNTTIVPLAGVVLGGSGENRTVTITPANGQTGSVTVTVYVSDGVYTVLSSFVVTVNPVTPVVNVTSVSLYADKSRIAIDGTGLNEVDSVSIAGIANTFTILSVTEGQVVAQIDTNLTVTQGTNYTLQVGSPTSSDTATLQFEIDDGAVETATFANLAVETADIANGGIASADITAGSVGTTQIQDDTLTTAKFANGAVTNAKLSANVFITPETTRTVSIPANKTAAEIQAIVDGVGKYIPNGISITFQFTNGTYTLTEAVNFKGFYGGGIIYVYGDTSQSAPIITQNVVLDAPNCNSALKFEDLDLYLVQVRNIKMTLRSTSAACTGLPSPAGLYVNNVNNFETYGNYYTGNNNTDGYGHLITALGNTIVYSAYDMFANAYMGFVAYRGAYVRLNNQGDTGGTGVRYGGYAYGGFWSNGNIARNVNNASYASGGMGW